MDNVKKIVKQPEKVENDLRVVFRKQQIDENTYNKVVVVYKGRDLFNLKLDYSQKQVIDGLITEADYDSFKID